MSKKDSNETRNETKKEMTRLELILKKGYSVIKLPFREGKINRAIQSALANAEENELDAKEKSLAVLEKLHDAEDIGAVINEYVQLQNEIDNWKKTKKYVEKLKSDLTEKVVIEEE